MALAQNPSIAALSNLVLYYDASNVKSYPGAGTSILDMSGNSNTGTLTNGPVWSAANNGVISFDGTNDYIETSFTPSNICTFNIWFYNNLTYNANNRGLFSTYASASFNGMYIGTTTAISNGLRFFYNSNSFTNLNYSFSINTWYNITVTSSGSQILIYVNGILTNTISGATTHADVLNIGRTRFDTNYWSGFVANFQVYNTALTAAQVQQNYNATKSRFINTPFAPTDISGLKLWLDVDDPRTLFSNTSGTTRATTDGTAVALWADKSGNGNNVSQSTGSYQPLLKTSVLNNRNVIRFDGSNDYLVSGANLGISGASARTFFCVTKFATVASTQYTALGYGSTTNSSGFSLTANAGNWYFSGYNNDTTGNAADTDYNIHSFYYDGTNVYWYTDGGNVSSFPVAKTLNTTDSTIKIGTRQDIVSYLNGDVAEVLVYNSALSVSNRLKVEQYLQNKWGVVTPFLPTQISGLTLWLDANDSGSLYQVSNGTNPAVNNNDFIGLWKDKSGNSNNATQSSSSLRPYVVASGQNNKNVVRFPYAAWNAASGPYMNATIGSLSAYTVYIALKYRTNEFYSMVLTGGSSQFELRNYSTTGYIEWNVAGSFFLRDTASNVGNWIIIGLTRSGSDYTIYKNGSVVATSNNASNLNIGSTIYISSRSGNSYYFDGDIGEMLIYNSALSLAQRQQVEAYLNQKWGAF